MELIPIYINGQEYLLHPTKDFLQSGASGKCYRLKTNSVDLTVKLYHQSSCMFEGLPWVPDENTLNQFINLSSLTSPILLSQYLVRDSDNQYIRCARDYIEKVYDDTVGAIFNLPKDEVFTYFKSIEDKIPFFDEHGVILDDWNTDNVMFGRIHNGPISLFLFDDTNYTTSDHFPCYNFPEFNLLIEDAIEEYLINIKCEEILPYIINDLRNNDNHLYFLKSASYNSDTIGEGILKYSKKIKKNYF